MKRLRLVFPALLVLGFGACAGDPQADEAGENLGTIAVALTSAPADAACIELTVSGSRVVRKAVALTPGASTVFLLDKLPAGLATVEGAAFAESCAGRPATATPLYVTESAFPVRIDPAAIVQVVLKLIRNGRLNVAVDFETPPWVSTATTPISLAVFGDTPYGAAQIADMPNFVASINADTSLVASVHVGDIKNGSSRCDTSAFALVANGFNALKTPFLFTPGDNEWTDCHRANNGAYDPLERLGVLRSLFYPVPGLSLGQTKKQVLSQSSIPGYEAFVENQLWVEGGATFSLLHVVGSNNGLAPWFGDDPTKMKIDDPVRRLAEVAARDAANLAWLDKTFAQAALYKSATVVLMIQADTWDGSRSEGFDAFVQKVAALTLAFGKPVLLIEGDSHIYKVDNPLAAGDAVHGVTTPVPNLTRLVVQGSTTAALSEWLKLKIDTSASPPFSWTRVIR